MGSEVGEMLPAERTLDEVDDNILSEILLRLPPQPSSLPRASAVSKRWHSIACNPGFCRRFRRHHRRSTPLLGFFDPKDFLTFVPTLGAPNRVIPGRFSLRYDDTDEELGYESCGCRHGLVLIIEDSYRHILVWDPVTGDQHRLDIPPSLDIPRQFESDIIMCGAVLRDAGDVHFRVVLVVEVRQPRQALACIYSGETKLWGDRISIPLPPQAMMIFDTPAVLVGDSLYWQLYHSFSGILELNLERQSLAVIGVPVDTYSYCFSVIPEEGGGPGFLSVSHFTAQLWKRKTDCDGIASWVLGRTIELDKLLSLNPDEHHHIYIRGIAEEKSLVFLSTVIGLFMVQLQSLQFSFMKYPENFRKWPYSFHPFESVYTAGNRL